MALRFSSGMVQKLMQNKGLKEALLEGCVRVYSGSQPATADAAPTGTLLLTVSKASATYTEGAHSTAQVNSLTITDASVADSDTYTITITPSPSEYSAQAFSFVTDASATANELAQGLCDVINEESRYVVATHNEGGATNIMYITASYPGQGFAAITLTTNPGTAIATAAVVTNVRVNGLQFGLSTAGVLAKEADLVWSGAVAATGTAGWFRFQANAVDDNSLSTTLIRMDGACGTSNSDMNLSSVNLVAATTVTVDTFSITQPKVRT